MTLDVSCDELRRAAGLLSDLRERLPDVDEIQRAQREVDGRLRVAVRGRPGTGRDTMARAIRDRLQVTPIGPGDDDTDADVWLYIVVGWPRAADQGALRRLPPERTVVVLGKADTLGSWDSARRSAHACAADLGRSVYPTMPLLGCVDLTDEDFALLERLLHDDEPMPSMAAQFITGDRSERLLRTGLLRRLDQFGILTALDLLDDAAVAGTPLDRVTLESLVHRQSGLSSLRVPFGAMLDLVRVRRLHVIAGLLDRVAATGIARDEIEHTVAVLTGGMRP